MHYSILLPEIHLFTGKLKQVVILLACFFVLPACNQNNTATEAISNTKPEANAGSVKTINSQEAKDLLTQQTNVGVLDVRTPEEFTGGHLANALNLDFKASGFSNQLTRLDKTKPYLVYCAVGGRSSKAAKLMHEMGFLQVYTVSEGYPQLKGVGLAVK